MKTIHKTEHTKTVHNVEWDEYVVKFYDKNGTYNRKADYHTSDREDAIDTACWYEKNMK